MRADIFKLLAIALPLSVLAEDFCDRQSATHPDLLRGQKGSDASDPYWFEHVSDIESAPHHRRVIYGIKNLSPNLELWAEWTRSDGKVQLSFARIAPGRCAQEYFETTKRVVEDAKATVKYGQTKQPVKNNCSLYIETDQPAVSPTPTPSVVQSPTATPSKSHRPPLRSCIKGTLKRGKGDTAELHLEFQTRVNDKQFVYTVTNQGSARERFRIPALAETWAARSNGVGYTEPQKWTVQGHDFAADPTREPSSYIVQTKEPVEATDVQLALEVVAESGEVIAAGPVTMYIPDVSAR
jgi:hypothetical protein